MSYPTYLNYTDGTTLSLTMRQEPKVLLGKDGEPSHLVNSCGTGAIGQGGLSFVCIQPICTAAKREAGEC